MTRQRLRPAWSAQELARIYATPHDHRRFHDHELRVAATIQVGRWLVGDGAGSAADLSCGNGAVLKGMPAHSKIYGDFAPGYPHTGPLEETLPRIPHVGLYVCTETLEHLDDPDQALKLMRDKANRLLLSTPVDAWNDDNEEHYWAWSRRDVQAMLAAAGFRSVVYAEVDFRPFSVYSFGIWGCQ